MALLSRNETKSNSASLNTQQATIVVSHSESMKVEETLQTSDKKRNQTRDYMKIFGGQAFSLVGSALVQFSLVWWLTYSTGSAVMLSLATMMVILP
ncbi:MAG: hypothetical protein ACFFEE_12365, partial [Candidatus Thorarchaeota archaeon]